MLLALSPGNGLAGTTINVPAGDTTALIDAITDANSEAGAYVGADTIVLETGTFSFSAADNTTYFSGNALPVITSEIVIEGHGSVLERSGGPEFRLMAVGKTGDLTLEESTITGGGCRSTTGGGLLVVGGVAGTETGGRLTLLGSTLSDNTASRGGGLYNRGGFDDSSQGGTVTMTNSTLSGNTALRGGGLYNGGGFNDFSTGGTVTMTNTTFSGNTATNGSGGGLFNDGGYYDFSTGGTVTMTNTTISGNTAYHGGGGLFIFTTRSQGTEATVTLTRSIVSGNQRSSSGSEPGEVYNFGTITADAQNIFGHAGVSNATAFTGFTPSGSDVNATSSGVNIPLANILDSALANNGGPTETHALVSGSPALDRVACGLTEDQRGYGRDDGQCDSGAIEYNGTPPSTDPCASLVATAGCKVGGVPNQVCQADDSGQIVVGTAGDDVILGGVGMTLSGGKPGTMWCVAGRGMMC